MLVRHVSGIITGFILAATFLVYDATFIVYQTQMALVIRLGQPIHSVIEPGLHLKMPLIDRAISIDRRILDLEIPAQEIIASDQKRLVIRTFARYRIIHPLKPDEF